MDIAELIKFVLGRPQDLDEMFEAFKANDIYSSFIILDSADGGLFIVFDKRVERAQVISSLFTGAEQLGYGYQW